ncbi:MAG: glycosyltransferase family 2 protein, partial [Deltaproteobacteria bacterium]|nr:glycosyltransferase family 2 protein [Deltaproteobacteria bacterium]
MPDQVRRYLSLCAVAKDETPYLREWAAYHYLIGFEKIFIYDNESRVPIREALADFSEAGIVETYTIAGRGMQLTAYNHCLRDHGAGFVWMAFFDLDEFLFLPQERDARSLLAEYEGYAGLTVNMCTFGSSGHLARPAGLVLENYLERNKPEVFVKSIVRPELVKMPLSPHDFIYKQGYYAVNADLCPAIGGFAPVTTDLARINHYPFRSQQDYEEKIVRGDAIYVTKNPRNYETFYAQARARGQRDTGILRHVPQVKAMLENKAFAQYLAVDTAALAQESLPEVLRRLGDALKERKADLARLIFKLCRRRFAAESAFLSLGVKICLLSKDF